ncbi:MAG: glycosyltransferase family 4 protein [Actinobacteria bacterium]|nr:glycosyltransferase family 4 protein [Actinomycetota bacterium]
MKARKTRVLQVIGGSEFGGAVWVILSYIKLLQVKGFQVLVCASAEPVARIYREAGCEIVPVPEMHRSINPYLDSIAFFKLCRICRNHKIDIVHTHTSKGGMLGRAAGRFSRVPVIIHTVHGFAFHETSPLLSIKGYAAMERLAARWCDKIITVSEFHRRWAIQLGIAPPDKICTVHNGISAARLKDARPVAAIRRGLDIKEDCFLIGTFGRLAPQKGLESLLRAMRTVTKEIPAARLLIVGDGPAAGSLKGLSRQLGLDDVVKFTGFIASVGGMMKACDLIVSPTLREGLSISIMEAMAQGKPVITTNISSNMELIVDGETGVLVSPGDDAQLSHEIIGLARDEGLRQRYGKAAARRFELHFGEKKMQDDLWNIYQQLMHAKAAFG